MIARAPSAAPLVGILQREIGGPRHLTRDLDHADAGAGVRTSSDATVSVIGLLPPSWFCDDPSARIVMKSESRVISKISR